MFFTIIVASYNDLHKLKNLLSDLDLQDKKCFELLVSVGTSSDGTEEYLRAYRPEYDIKIVSGKDTGLYDALNKLLPYIRGNYTICLGADERVLSRAFFARLALALSGRNTAIYYTDLLIGKVESYRIKNYPEPVIFRKRFGGLAHLHHQTVFLPSNFLKEYAFDTLLKTHADLDMMLNAQKRFNIFKIPEIGILFAEDGKSARKSDVMKNFLEIARIRRRHSLKPFNLFCVLSFLRVLLK